MEIRAEAKYIRVSPRKARLVADLIRNLDVEEAENQLGFLNKVAAEPIFKLLRSAVSNALHNFKLKKENLYIKEIQVNGGPALKRWKPRAFGRATPIKKRSAHISIVLGERKASAPSLRKKLLEKKEKPQVVPTLKSFTSEKKISRKPAEIQKSEKKEVSKEYKKTKGFLKRIFTRKTG